MIKYIVISIGLIWVAGYLCTIYKLRQIPGYPIDYRNLAVLWPLTLVAVYALDPDGLLEQLEDLQTEIPEDGSGDP